MVPAMKATVPAKEILNKNPDYRIRLRVKKSSQSEQKFLSYERRQTNRQTNRPKCTTLALPAASKGNETLTCIYHKKSVGLTLIYFFKYDLHIIVDKIVSILDSHHGMSLGLVQHHAINPADPIWPVDIFPI